MINNYYTLREILREGKTTIVGSVIVQCYTQERNRLVVSTEMDTDELSILISCEPRLPFLYLRSRTHRARKNTFDALPNTRNKRISHVSLHPSDRQITLKLEDESSVIIQLFGSRSNVYQVDDVGIIQDSFLRPRDFIGTKLELPEEVSPQPTTYESFCSSLFSHSELSLKETLRQTLPLFGSTLHRELAVRSEIQIETPIGKISDFSRTRLWDSYIEILEELSDASPRIYFEEDKPIEMGLIHLAQYYGKPERPFQSCSEAVRTFVNLGLKQHTIDKQKRDLETRLSNELRKAKRSLQAITEELSHPDRSATYEHMATLLMANPQLETKGKETVELEDFNYPRKLITVPVDPRLSVIENAQRYFNRARKARHSRTEAERRLTVIEQRIDRIQRLFSDLETVRDPKELKSFYRNNQHVLTSTGIRMSKETREEIPFRVFHVTGGFEVWAGKSSANNDLLTMKYAKPHDLWFHTRGAGGSHVVLRRNSKNEIVPKEAIEEAASIAAYYSKMKSAKLVPVAMTERKYVRKRKGDPPGTVVISREQVILVAPGLPKDKQQA